MKEAPIFIHSLFRSGSTYLFSLLRRSPEVYCYYESMHELVAWAADDVSRLEGEAHADKMRALHHPVMEDAYFSELREVWPCWKQLLKPRQVYGGYFSDDPEEAGVAFFEALNKAAPRRAVFSECRTAGRIPVLKKELGGQHAFLWRNPRDQWWSNQIEPYFDAANRVITHADPAPDGLSALVADLALSVSPIHSYSEARDFYHQRPLGLELSYAWFYGLWLLTLDIASEHADLLINIDSLTHDAEHRDLITASLGEWGVPDLEFCDAASPAALYTENEIEVFEQAEERVHRILRRAGWTQKRLKQLQTLRKNHQPPLPSPSEALSQQTAHRQTLIALRETDVTRAAIWADVCGEQEERLGHWGRELEARARRIAHDEKVFGIREKQAELSALRLAEKDLELNEKDLEMAAQDLRLTHSQVEFARAVDAINTELSGNIDSVNRELAQKLDHISNALQQISNELQQISNELHQANRYIEEVKVSLSWRISAPVRWLGSLALWLRDIAGELTLRLPLKLLLALTNRSPRRQGPAQKIVAQSPSPGRTVARDASRESSFIEDTTRNASSLAADSEAPPSEAKDHGGLLPPHLTDVRLQMIAMAPVTILPREELIPDGAVDSVCEPILLAGRVEVATLANTSEGSLTTARSKFIYGRLEEAARRGDLDDAAYDSTAD